MPRIVLHIGYPKTGTTAIQWFLTTHRDTLCRHGVWYPKAGQTEFLGHHALALVVGEPGESRLYEALDDEMARCGCETVVLSSEHFVPRLEAVRASSIFRTRVGRHPLRVVVFIRRQDAILASLYRQLICDPGVKLTADPAAFVRRTTAMADYYAVLSRWRRFVGQEALTIVVYEQAEQAGGSVPAFCRALGLDPAELPGEPEARRNDALFGYVGTEFMRVLNALPDLTDEQRNALAGKVRMLDVEAADLGLPRAPFLPELRARVRDRFRESNKRLAAELVGQPLDGFWFREAPPPRPGS